MAMPLQYPWHALTHVGASFYVPHKEPRAVRAAFNRYRQRNPGTDVRVRITSRSVGTVVERIA